MRKYELEKLDCNFIEFLKEDAKLLQEKRKIALPLTSVELLNFAKKLDAFFIEYFSINLDKYKQKLDLMEKKSVVKRDFIQRKVFAHFKTFEGKSPPFLSEEEFVEIVLSGERGEEMKEYAKFALFTEEGGRRHQNGMLFDLPKPTKTPFKINENQVAEYKGDSHFSNTEEQNFWMTKYCIHCHKQKRDYCRTENPLSQAKGCPLDQKISEMNLLKSKGFLFAPLAVMMVDNPLCILTGHRICNDCKKSCIFQKQTPVDVPSIETQILMDVLNLPFGFEFYRILTMWNPLLTKNFLPSKYNGKKVLVCGAGPSGILSSYYFLREGFEVLLIDGLKLAPINHLEPIKNVEDILKKERKNKGFGGVMEYGITDRWNKNLLILTQILLERMEGFNLLGGKKFGEDITLEWARKQGFCHVLMCIGAGKPTLPQTTFSHQKGVMTASNFLMSAHLNEKWTKENIVSPVLVIGAGLTAMDVSLLAKKSGFDVKIFARGKLENSRAFLGNELELEDVLFNKIQVFEQREFKSVIPKKFAIFYNKETKKEEVFKCGTIIFALGTKPNLEPLEKEEDISFFTILGDLDKKYEGSVVKALASVKNKKDELFERLKNATTTPQTSYNQKTDDIIAKEEYKGLTKIMIKPAIMPLNPRAFDVYKLQILDTDFHPIPLTLFEWGQDFLTFYVKIVGLGTKHLVKNFCKILLTKTTSCNYTFDEIVTDDVSFLGLAGMKLLHSYRDDGQKTLFYVKDIVNVSHFCKPNHFIFLFCEMNCMLSGICSRCLTQKKDGSFFYACKENIVEISKLIAS
jgi:NADPH-dependent glutamate synthase beta subunit-like oxidoreductase